MLVTDGRGIPIGLHLESAQQAEITLARITLETVHVQPARGRPRTRPQHLVADKGYDSRDFRRYLHRRGIGHTIPPIRRRGKRRHGQPRPADPVRYAQRWIIERTNAWLQNYRRVQTRHERLLSNYRAFVVLACILITLRNL